MMTPLAVLLSTIAIPPQMAVTIHHPEANLPKLRPALEWAGRADLYLRPDRIERWAAGTFGIAKPFDPASMAALGLDPKAPIKAMMATSSGPFIFELSVKDAKKVDKAIAALPRARPLEAKGARWARAVMVHPTGSLPLLIARVDRRLIAQEITDPTRVLELFREGEATDRPKRGKGPVTVEIWEAGPLDRGLVEIELESGQLRAKGTGTLSLAARLLANDLLADQPARRYLAPLKPIAELSGTAGPGAIREALIEAGLPPAEAETAKRLFSGEHAVALTPEGLLAGVMRLSGSASKKEVAAFTERIRQLQPGLSVQHLGGFLLGSFPGTDPNATPAVSEKQLGSAAKAEGPIELFVDPRSLTRALRHRARARTGPRVSAAHLTLFEMIFQSLLRTTSSTKIVASRTRGEVQVNAVVQYDSR